MKNLKKIKEVFPIRQRINYLEKTLELSRSDDQKEYSKSILLFSLFIENVSLFS